MNDLLIYVVYPLTVGGVFSLFAVVYRLFSNLITKVLTHEIHIAQHQEQILHLQKRHH